MSLVVDQHHFSVGILDGFILGGFLKWWVSPTISMGFPTKNDHFAVFWG